MINLRRLTTALFVLGIFCLAGCSRAWDRSCDPCMPGPRYESCPPVSCGPCYDTPACGAPCGPTNVCVQPQPCNPTQGFVNPYFPCDSTMSSCGNMGGCNMPPSCPEVCYGPLKSYSTCDDCVVDLCQVAPETATVGSPYPVQIVLTARKECADVVVTQTLPCDSEFICAEPQVFPNAENKLQWAFPHLELGQSQTITVWVKPLREGCCLAAATVCACPQLCAYTKCGQPVICIKKCGPSCACLYCPIVYTIDVCNTGSATAFDVVVQDTVPDGLTHASGYRCLNYNLGNLCPGESRRLEVEFCSQRRGMVTNTASVSYCGGPICTAEATTIINQPCVEVTKTGADWAYVCKPVEYTITVTNPGDLVLRNVVVDDVSPAGTIVADAPGAEVCCNRATWCVPELCPGETRTFNVTLRSQVTGCLTNQVTVTSQSDCGPCQVCAEAMTCWKGIPAIHMCMVDTADPICIGDSTVYRVCITNQGTADDENVQLVVNFTNELLPQSFNGATRGSINGNTVTFERIERLAPKQSVEYSITVKGVAAGDARGEATLTSDMLSAPVTDVESTHVY